MSPARLIGDPLRNGRRARVRRCALADLSGEDEDEGARSRGGGRDLLEGQVLEPDELDVEPKTTGRQVGEHERPVRLAQRGEGFGKRL